MDKFQLAQPIFGHVRKDTKKVPYTITPIGDINLYRREREDFELAWDRNYQEHNAHRRALALSGVAEQNLELKFDEVDKTEIEHRNGRHRKEAAPSQCTKDACLYMPQEQVKPPQTLLGAAKKFCAKIWHDAFRTERE